MNAAEMAKTVMLLRQVYLLLAGCTFLHVLPCGSATSTGPRGSFPGQHGETLASDSVATTEAPLPNPEFFLNGLIDKFGKNGRLDKQEFHYLLQRVDAEVCH